MWSGEDGTHLRTLVGHTRGVFSLAVGLDGKVYSGSDDNTIRVWSPDDGAHLYTLEGHTSTVRALAVGPDGKVFSGSPDDTRVWSGVSGAHLHTLNHGAVCCTIGRNGAMYSCSGTSVMIWR